MKKGGELTNGKRAATQQHSTRRKLIESTLLCRPYFLTRDKNAKLIKES
jgi:hypothetical protein